MARQLLSMKVGSKNFHSLPSFLGLIRRQFKAAESRYTA
jgi:hypothetical protein